MEIHSGLCKLSRFILLLFILVPEVVVAGNFSSLSQVNQLQQQGISYFASGGDYKKYESDVYSGATVKGSLSQAINSFSAAYQLAPERFDLAFSVASLQVLAGDLAAAENSYRSLEEKMPNDLTVLTFETAYALAWGESSEYQYYLKKLNKLASPDVLKYTMAIKVAESSFNLPLNRKLIVADNLSDNMAIVILGYALNNDGSMDKKLIERLKLGLTAAKTYPHAKIIVSGGAPQGGVTEAYVMQKWLRINGVNIDRIILEDQSSDTVNNAVNCIPIIQRLNVDHVLLVSSASHIRRATAVFREALALQQLAVSTGNLTFEESSTIMSSYPGITERALIVRDTLRVAGLWALPGMVR